MADIRDALGQADVNSIRVAIDSENTVNVGGFELGAEDILVNADALEGYSTLGAANR